MTSPPSEESPQREHKHTTCYMCACRCGVRLTLENGKIRFIQGTPNHPVNRGVLCGKGNAAIMKQLSPAKLRAPLLRRKGMARGTGVFDEISWEQALEMLTARLAAIRADDPNKLGFFTGRDQMQAFTGLWARQFGTMNWAAHGGFCSVNMAAAGLLTTGYSFWEFGEPDWEHARMLMLWGVAEDHASNPIKLGLKKLKERGAKIVAINPVRTGYQAIADEWVAIRPGTDGMLALSMAQVLLSRRLVDEEFLARHTNAPYLTLWQPGEESHGLIARDEKDKPLCFDVNSDTVVACVAGSTPALSWEGKLADGRRVKSVFHLLRERIMRDEYAPPRAAVECGVAAADIERLALEAAHAAFNSDVFVPTPWTDWAGRKHDGFVGRPLAMHAMRGVSAHANGFQTCRALHILQALLGAIDAPGSHLAKPPYPKPPPCLPPPAISRLPNTPLASPPLGAPRGPEDLAVDAAGAPLRIDGAFSWDAPLAMHGALHTVLANAAAGKPYFLDTLIIFMANMAWNSSLNPDDARAAMTATNADGRYRIPFIVTVDAFHSEMVDYADLVLPDTTYLERADVISLLDRPISDVESACDAIRAPVLKPDRDVRPWQEVMLELGSRLNFPALVDDNGERKYRDYADFIVNYEAAPGVGFLSGWRGGDHPVRGKANPKQWEEYEKNYCFYSAKIPTSARYSRFSNRDYMRFAKEAGWISSDDSPMTVELYSETLRKFQLAGEGFGARVPPDERQRHRLREHFDPLPFWSPPPVAAGYSFYAVTQRPMFMYHSWDSQNAWLRQIADRNPVFMQRQRGRELGIADGAAVWLSSVRGKIGARIKLMDGVRNDTLWTWNAIAKGAGNWGLSPRAREVTDSFLMNHLISERACDPVFSNSDPVTGQAAWYDLRLNVTLMTAAEEAQEFPQDEEQSAMARQDAAYDKPLRHIVGKPVRLYRPMRDVLFGK